ncbi:CDC24-domain-containing protein [Linnemannia elongata AG-77]|uniref:CDC24-domain-containing protein n=1 Tax=Linnemannia elongata AG-77 TaxID=1314771 RepID=A0A197K4Z2_9FUNG|nr:CDC24-domain-containing protein [Linnemannia elongata AG-77]
MSLQASCLNLMDRLAGVPDFDHFLNPTLLLQLQANSNAIWETTPNDPVSQLWILFRLGTPLACILNSVRPPNQQLNVDSGDLSFANINACKERVFHFIVACLQDLHFTHENVFTISELYHDNPEGFLKVLNTVGKVLDRLEASPGLGATAV